MTSVADLFVHANVPHAGVVRWGNAVPLDAPGVYVVSTSADADEHSGPPDCPLDLTAIDALLRARPEATVDGTAATPALIADRLRAMWPSGEPVVYIGLAGIDTQHRVNQFYRTPIGARAPHAGGWPVKMLNTDALWVHYGSTDDSATAEAAMIQHFVTNVPDGVAHALVDPAAPLPFANLAFPGGRRKTHGLQGVKAPRVVTGEHHAEARPSQPPGNGSDPGGDKQPATVGLVRSTQNVTATDVGNGQLRVPRASKSIFPTTKARIEVELSGDTHTASWDPKTDGDKERSGVIRVGKGILTNYITAGPPRRIETTPTGYRIS